MQFYVLFFSHSRLSYAAGFISYLLTWIFITVALSEHGRNIAEKVYIIVACIVMFLTGAGVVIMCLQIADMQAKMAREKIQRDTEFSYVLDQLDEYLLTL